jgi:hypothetical protein
MKILTPGQLGTISATVDATVDAGVTLTGVTFDVIDALGNVLQASGAGTVGGANFPATVSLDMGLPVTTLGAGESRAIRQARMVLTCSDGNTFDGTVDFLVRGDDALVIPTNSFGTYLELELLGFEQYGLDAYWSASKNARIAALQQARNDLCRLTYRYDPRDDQTLMADAISLFTIYLGSYTLDQFNALPARLKEAIKRAQVIQADYILGGNEVEKRRGEGVLQSTTGESGAMFRPGMAPIRYPVCKRAMDALYGFLEMNKWQIARG